MKTLEIGWVQDKIGNLPIALIDGDRSKKYPKRSEFQEKGVAFLNAQSISGGRFDISKVNYISYEKYEEISKGRLQQNDLILTMRGNGVGDVALFSSKISTGLINAQMLILRPNNEKINSTFLYYGFTNPRFKSEIANFVTGSAQPQLTITHLRHVPITLPPISEQKAIAHVLGALDDRIELNRRMNETLESMAQALFKSWFVDFDPVIDNALASGKGIPAELSDRAAARAALGNKRQPLPEEIRTLFPDEFTHSPELGWIPKGWERKQIGDVVKRFPVGKKYSQKTASDKGKIPILDQGKSGIIGYHDDLPGVTATPDDPVIVFANHTCYMRLIMHDFSAIQNVLPFKGVEQNIFWVYSATYGKQEFMEYKGHWPDFVIQKLVIPNKNLDEIFGEYVAASHKKIFQTEIQSRNLEELRDTLLPKLLSGEIRIPEAGKMVEELAL